MAHRYDRKVQNVSIADKTRDTIERGKENRGDFTPKAGSVPVRMYNYWLRQSKTPGAALIRTGARKENFCHYWRVVAIWAPLRALLNAGDAFLNSRFAGAAIIAVGVALLAYGALTINGFWSGLLIALGIILGISAAIAAIVGSAILVCEKIPEKFPNFARRVENVFKSPKTWLGLGGLVVAGIIVLTSGTNPVSYLVWGLIIGSLTLAGLAIVKLIDYENGKAAKRQEEWDALTWEDQDKIIDYLDYINNVKKEPSRIQVAIVNFFGHIYDFLELGVQVVRVNKWKICPLVEIPQETEKV